MNSHNRQGKLYFVILSAVLVMGSGCSDSDAPLEITTSIKELPQPSVRDIGPTSLAAGDKLTIMGEGFVPPDVGKTRLMITGTFQATSGLSHQVEMQIEPEYINQGILEWTFGPNIPFADQLAQDTGYFRGVVSAVNVGADGETRQSADNHPADIQVLPSIIVEQMRPTTEGCHVGITGTTEATPFMFHMKTVGLHEGTPTAPLRYVYTFLRSQFRFSDNVSTNPGDMFPPSGPVSVIDDVVDGADSILGDGAGRKVRIEAGDFTKGNLAQSVGSLLDAAENMFGLIGIETAQLPEGDANFIDASIIVMAIDATGSQARRTIPLRIWSPIEMVYDGNTEVVRSFDPIPVTGCMPGGQIGRVIDYQEQNEEKKMRSLRFHSLAGGDAGFSLGFDSNSLSARANLAFGIDVFAEVSSSTTKSLNMTGKILPDEFGVFYRQTLQIERRAKLISHGACGNSQPVGEAVVTDWIWSPDLAKTLQGRPCPPLPPSNLDPGQIFKQSAIK